MSFEDLASSDFFFEYLEPDTLRLLLQTSSSLLGGLAPYVRELRLTLKELWIVPRLVELRALTIAPVRLDQLDRLTLAALPPTLCSLTVEIDAGDVRRHRVRWNSDVHRTRVFGVCAPALVPALAHLIGTLPASSRLEALRIIGLPYGPAPLRFACAHGMRSTVRALLKQGGAAVCEESLLLACIGGHADCVKLLLERRDTWGEATLLDGLEDACRCGDRTRAEECVQLLAPRAAAASAAGAVVEACGAGLDRCAWLLLERAGGALAPATVHEALRRACLQADDHAAARVRCVEMLLPLRAADAPPAELPLCEACKSGLLCVPQLLAAGADPNGRLDGEPSYTALMCATLASSPEGELCARALLRAGADVHATTAPSTPHCTALMLACHEGDDAMVRLLVAHGARVDGGDGLTPLMCVLSHAAQDGERRRMRCVDALLRAGAAVDSSVGGMTALAHAAKNGLLACARRLLREGASPNTRLGDGNTMLTLAARTAKGRALVGELLDAGADANARCNEETALHCACRSDDPSVVQCVRQLLHAGAAVDARDGKGQTPLHLAAQSLNTAAVELLLAAGTAVDARSGSNETPLHLASARTEAGAMVDVLLRARADANARDDWLTTPLHLAADRGTARVVEALLRARADVDARNRSQATPLHKAASNGSTSAIEVLVRAGADLHSRSHRAQTPLHLAASSADSSSVEALLRAGADPNARNELGLTPLRLTLLPRSTELLQAVTADGE